jgi:hypothetical protein
MPSPTGSDKIPENRAPWSQRRRQVKKIALAGFFLLLVVFGIAYHSSHQPAPAGVDAAAPGQSLAIGQAGDAGATGTQWVTVRDTREKAFSIQVPQGWKTYGGLFRFSTIDARMIVDMTSPDGLTNLRVGDSTVPPYRVPGPFLRPGPGVAAYTAGNVFATRYGQARFATMCQGVQLTKSDALAPKYHPAASGISHTTAGETFFRCTKSGAPMAAYVYAETMLMGPGEPGSTWVVVALGSLMAPAEQAEAAGATLQHSGESLVMNPAWIAMQNQLNNRAIQQINAATRATIAATNAENAREHAMISQLQNDSFNDVINGVQATVDATTGQHYITPLGQGGRQWVNGNNLVVESGLSPGAGFTALTPVNR